MFTKICEIRLDMYIFTIFGTTLVVLKKNLSLIKSHVKVPTFIFGPHHFQNSKEGPALFKVLYNVFISDEDDLEDWLNDYLSD